MDAAQPAYVIALDFEGDRIATIRDWRYVGYLARELDFELWAELGG